tara:strand:- start:351 stop:584 length:234 start_codon:yes stop_codon:yes gene_type:complete
VELRKQLVVISVSMVEKRFIPLQIAKPLNSQHHLAKLWNMFLSLAVAAVVDRKVVVAVPVVTALEAHRLLDHYLLAL